MTTQERIEETVKKLCNSSFRGERFERYPSEEEVRQALTEISLSAKKEEQDRILKALEEASVWDVEYLYTRKARLIEYLQSLTK